MKRDFALFAREPGGGGSLLFIGLLRAPGERAGAGLSLFINKLTGRSTK